MKTSIAALFASAFLACMPAAAQECTGPMKIVVGLAAGGGTDNVARTLAQRYTALYGQPVVVENRLGANSNIATEYVAKAPRDGCTLMLKGNEHHTNALIYARPGYELKDFVPVMHVVNGPVLLVAHPGQPYKTLAEFVAYAKAHPGQLSYGSAGIGSATQVAMEIFTRAAGVDVAHIPYKGSAASLADAAGGTLPLTVASVSASLPFISSGRLVPLAVSGQTRWPALPNVPTLAESGYPQATYWYWMGLLAPAGTPQPALARISQQFRTVMEEPAVRERLLAQGYLAVGGTVQDFGKVLQQSEQAERKLNETLKLKVE